MKNDRLEISLYNITSKSGDNTQPSTEDASGFNDVIFVKKHFFTKARLILAHIKKYKRIINIS